jgi:hypothetical protein
MAREDKVIVIVKELKRLGVIHQIKEKKITQGMAGEHLGLMDQPVRRVIKRER